MYSYKSIFFIEQAYTSIQQLADSLKSGEVEAVLIDVYSAATNEHIFKHPTIRVQDIIKYDKPYGLILSGDLVNVHEEIRDFIASNQALILQIVENSTTRMSVSKHFTIDIN